MPKSKNQKIIFTLISMVFFMPSIIFASTIYVDAEHSSYHVGDNIIFNVKIDSEGKNINAIEGLVDMDYGLKSVSVNDISLSESAFSLWARKPSLSIDSKNINFVGGVPKGLKSKDAIIFKIILNLEKTGELSISPKNVTVYLNDGKGTTDTVNIKNLVINILPREVAVGISNDKDILLSRDRTPPEPFVINIGQDGSIFDGKKFISFNTIDKGSDVEYYEVVEGDLAPIRSGNTYVLQDQDNIHKITVFAYDTSGNKRESVYDPDSPKISYKYGLIGVLFIVLFWFVFKKNKNENI